jgi:hypothetical protein
VLKKIKKNQEDTTDSPVKAVPAPVQAVPPQSLVGANVPSVGFNQEAIEKAMSQESDPDLMTSYELVKLPSGGRFYSHKISEVSIEYMTSKDEDLLTTPSLIDSGKALNILLKRKIKTPGIVVEDLLEGDRNALVLFLRTSSYGADYTVNVPDPRTGIPFKTVVDLLRLEYMEIDEQPDDSGNFNVKLPMRKKLVKFRLLTSGEENQILRSAEAVKELYNHEFSEYSTMKLKAHIVSIGDKTDRDYIGKFVDAMPALDAYTIRKKILSVAPDVNMSYEFMAKDGYKFYANLAVGIDFFSPGT